MKLKYCQTAVFKICQIIDKSYYNVTFNDIMPYENLAVCIIFVLPIFKIYTNKSLGPLCVSVSFFSKKEEIHKKLEQVFKKYLVQNWI